MKAKSILKSLIGAVAAVGIAALTAPAAWAQVGVSDTATGTAIAEIVVEITIAANTPLDFGTLSDFVAGTVTVDPTTSVGTYNPTTLEFPGGGGTTIRGEFTVTGVNNALFSIILPTHTAAGDSGVTTITDGATDIEVFNFSDSKGGLNGAGATGAQLTGGSFILGIGATANIELADAVGNYTGTYDVIVQYD